MKGSRRGKEGLRESRRRNEEEIRRSKEGKGERGRKM